MDGDEEQDAWEEGDKGHTAPGEGGQRDPSPRRATGVIACVELSGDYDAAAEQARASSHLAPLTLKGVDSQTLMLLWAEPGARPPGHAVPIRRPELMMRLLLRCLKAAPNAAARQPLLRSIAAVAARGPPSAMLLPLAALCAQDRLVAEAQGLARQALLPCACPLWLVGCMHGYYARVFGVRWAQAIHHLLGFLSQHQDIEGEG